MTPEQNIFICCLKDFCHGNKTEEPNITFDKEIFFNTAEEQSLAGLFYCQCPWINKKEFHQAFLSDIFYSVNRRDMLQEITNKLSEQEIPFLCMKGSVFRDYYPVPELRSMGDIDIVIQPENKEKVDHIFVNELGYSKYVDNHSVWLYYIKEFQFEVHNHMFYEELTNDFNYVEYFDDIFDNMHLGSVFGISSQYMYVPDENYHFLYLMTHTAKHIINHGTGFRPYLDMVMFTQNNDLDWKWIKDELRKLKLLEFTETCFAFCERWFDVKMPLDHKELDKRFYDEITAKTFNDGTFGLENEENEGASSAKALKKSNGHYWLTTVRRTLRLIFPPYNDMILIPWYSFLNGKPWLLPFAWVYRWFYCIKHKFKESFRKISEPFRIKQKIEERQEYIDSWGL